MKRQVEKGHVICYNCGAEFEDYLTACPYCGVTWEPAAEKAYQKKLRTMQKDLAGMQGVSDEQTRHAAGHLGRWLFGIAAGVIAVIAVILILTRIGDSADRKEREKEYLWRTENYGIMDEYYENGQYDELIDFFDKASMAGHPVYDWEHSNFVICLSGLELAESILEREAEGDTLSDYDKEDLIFSELETYAYPYRHGITDADLEYMADRVKALQADLSVRTSISPEEIDEVISYAKKHDGYLSYTETKKLIKEQL